MQTKMAVLLGRMIALFFSVLLVLFPNSKNLTVLRQERDNRMEIWAPKIVEAIETKDVAALEDMMCLNIKQNTKNLPKEIQNFYDSIEGDILDIYWEPGLGSSYSESQQDGRQIVQYDFDVRITTTKTKYTAGIWWESVNNFQPEETKIRNIGLIYDDTYERVYRIAATNGIGSWHE